MTREEAINKLESLKISLPAAKDEISEIIKLIETPWISVKDDLPCNHEEMVHINPLDQFDQRTSWCLVSDGRFTSIDRMYNFTTYEWRWGTKLHNLKYWRPLPKLPK